jgi:hypothetical protein
MKNAKISKREIIRHIARMPFYQVHYTQKSIRANWDTIPDETKVAALKLCYAEQKKYGKLL